MKRWAGALVLTAMISQAALAQDELASEGSEAPRFRLPVYNAAAVGKTVVGLEDFVGLESEDKATKLLLVSFMASYCAPCKKEMPYLQKLHETYRDDGLRVMMIAIDGDAEGQKKIDDLIAKNQITYPVLRDRYTVVARRWLGSQSPLPSMFFVRPDATIEKAHSGYDEATSAKIMAEVTTTLGVEPIPMTAPAVAPAVASDAAPATVVPASTAKSLEMPPPPKGMKKLSAKSKKPARKKAASATNP